MCVLVAQLCLTPWDPMGCSLPGSSVHRILQARILEWVAISFSRGSSQSKNRTPVSCIAGRFFTIRATKEALNCIIVKNCPFIYAPNSDLRHQYPPAGGLLYGSCNLELPQLKNKIIRIGKKVISDTLCFIKLFALLVSQA